MSQVTPNRLDPDEGAEDPRVFAAVQEYLAAIEAGQPISRREMLARYPEIAAELGRCLDGLAFMQAAASEISGVPKSRKRRGDIDPAMAQPIGDFQLVQEIGQGGMGCVYEAIQLSLGRRVAVKVLPLAAALDARHLERFHLEAQAAARLHHGNIVPVYAVGCERSVHFYAMQLIDGQSLAELIRDLKKLAQKHAHPASDEIDGPIDDDEAIDKTSQSYSAMREKHGSAYAQSVARLAIQAADALAYAHDAGVVHRDIKPANLLLDSSGKLWITDFGLAQFYAESNLTRTGDFVGTLRYMSPEQASGRAVVLDQRTDIYSLGVTLYELLTLEPALPGKTHADLLRQLVDYQPRPPRAIDRTIPPELDTIISKAMAKDPADRYTSAAALAEDLRRFLRDEPILARRPSLRDKCWKWVRRHRHLTASAFLILALATLGFSISTFLIAREQVQTQIAYQLEKEKKIEADNERARAERNDRLARQAVESFARIASEEMDPPEFAQVRREMLEESLAYFESFLEEPAPTTSASADLSSTRARIGRYLDLFISLDGLMRARSRSWLLSEPSVRRDLGIDEDSAQAAMDAGREADFALNHPTTTPHLLWPEQRTHDTDDRIARIDLAVAKALGPSRFARLRQIQWQVMGPAAFDDPAIVEQLALELSQRRAIRTILNQYRHGHLVPGFQGDMQLALLKTNSVTRILALLNPAQRDAWNQAIGHPFNGSVRPAPGDGPRPPPPPMGP